MEQLVHRALPQARARAEHLGGVLLDVQSRNLRQLLGDHAVERRTGRRTEHQRVRQDGRAQQARDLRLDLHVLLAVHLRDDGRGAAERLVTEIDRPARFYRVDAVVVDNFDNVGRADTVCGLIALVVIDQNDRRALQIEQITLREHTDVSALFIQQRIIADALFGYRALYVIHRVLRLERDKALAAHDMAHRHGLTDDLDTGIGIQRRGDDGNVVLHRQLADGARHLRAEADDHAARVHLDGAQLALVAVAEDDHVVRADVVLHHIRVCGGNDHTALLEPFLDLTGDERAVQHIHQIAVAGLGLRECVRILILHVKARDVAQGQQTLQVAVLIDNGKRLDVVLVHVIPCAAQRHFRIDARHLAVLYVAHVRLERLDVARRLHAEMLQHILGFGVDMSGAAGDILAAGQPALEVRVADRRADRIRIRVSVSDNKNRLHSELPFILISDSAVSALSETGLPLILL